MRKSYALLAAVAISAGAWSAWAQDAATYDPNQLPAMHGKVAQYSLTPRGDVDGLILADGTEVHLPPHLGTSLVFAVKPGDTVTIRGLKARALPIVQAMSVTNDATGSTVTNTGPAGPAGPRGAMQTLTAESRIKTQLHGPRGDLNGVLLEDGTIIHLPPPEAQRMAATLAPGASLYVQGTGYAGPLGRLIDARSIGPSKDKLTQIAAPPPPPPPGRGHGHGHGPGADPVRDFAPAPGADPAPAANPAVSPPRTPANPG